MYRLIIADDEPLIREGLTRRREWGELGFEVVAGLEDGGDVLTFLKLQSADVVLADIRMYQVSGLEVAKEIGRHYPWMKVLLLSGYREFTYAQEALRYGVYDYLLKPIDFSELWRIFGKLRQELDRERQEKVLLQNVSEGDYMEMLSLIRTISHSVLDTGAGEETWVAYARMGPVLGEATDEVREFIVRKLLDQLRSDLEKKDTRLSEQFQREVESIQSGSPERCVEEMTALLKRLNDQIVGKQTRGWDDSIVKACKYISNHLSEEFSYKDVAAFVHLSPRHFIRRFQSERGETFTEYLIRIRISSAMKLLAEGRYSTADVCQAVGYRDEKYFRQLFKKQAGCSLREYAQRFNASAEQGERP